MKILFINSVYASGSTGKIVYDLKNVIEDKGKEAVVAYGRGSYSKEVNVVRISNPLEVYMHVFLARLTGLEGFYSPIATNRLENLIKLEKPDIIHIHNIHGYYLNYYSLINYIKKTGIPVIWTLHDELMFTGKCAYAFDCDHWMKGCEKCCEKKDYPKSWIFNTSSYLIKKKKELFRDFDNVVFVTPSNWLRGRVNRSILSGKKSIVIHNGIDISTVFYPREVGKLKETLSIGDKKVVLTVTDDVTSTRKGVSKTIDLAQMCENENIVFLIVGGKLNNFNASNVMFVEPVKDQSILAEYYSLADAFVITSQCDNYPTVCLEAIACGTPIIGFKTGGIPETCDSYDISAFVDINDLPAMKRELLRLIDCDKEEIVKMCRSYAEQYISRYRMIDGYLKLYEDLLHGCEI